MQRSLVFCAIFMVGFAQAGLLDVLITKQESGGEKIIHESHSKSKDGDGPLVIGETHVEEQEALKKVANKEVEVPEKLVPEVSEGSEYSETESEVKETQEEQDNTDGQNGNAECNCDNEMGLGMAAESSGEEKTDIGVLRPRSGTVIRAKRWGCCDCCCCGPTGPPVTGMPCGCCGCGWGK